MTQRSLPAPMRRPCALAALLVSTLLPAWAGGAAAPAAPTSAPLTGVLVDANGVAMGPFYPANIGASQTSTLLSLGGRPVLLALRKGRKVDSVDVLPQANGIAVIFKTADCTGDGWLDPNEGRPGLATASILPAATHHDVMVRISAGPAKPVNYQSYLSLQNNGNVRCNQLDGSATLQHVEQVIRLSDVYTAPYHVQ